MNFQDTIDLTRPIATKLLGWAKAGIALLPNFAVAVLMVILFGVAGRLTGLLLVRVLNRITDNRQFAIIGATVVRFGVALVGVFVALEVLGLEKTVTSLLAGVGVIGLALGFAFQDIASNFMAGLIIALRRDYPFKLGDLIEVSGYLGRVHAIHLRSTEIRLLTGQSLLLPNRNVLENPLINYSVTGERRVDVEVGVSYGDDLDKARASLKRALDGISAHASRGEAEALFIGFGDSSINMVGRFWIDLKREQADYVAAQSEAVLAITKAFRQDGLTIPFPIRTLDFGIVGGQKLNEMLPITAAPALPPPARADAAKEPAAT